MSEKKKESVVRTDLSPDEFMALNKTTKRKKSALPILKSVKNGMAKFNYVLSALGIMPVLINDSSSKGGPQKHGHVHHSPQNIRQTYKVEPPPPPSHEDMVKAHIAHDAYMKLVDGKGDNDCGHEH